MNNTGFSMVEVLIASLMIILGVTGYVTLQSEFVKADAHNSLRNVALHLAREKIDDLASFSQVESGENNLGYRDIDDNSGGLIPSGTVVVTLGNNQTNTRTFNRSWRVSKHYYVDADGDNVADAWVSQNHPSLGSPVPRFAAQKNVSVKIDWLDSQGDSQSVVLDTVLAPIAPSHSVITGSELSSVRQRPAIVFTPSLYPDSYMIEVSDNQYKQSASPIMEASEINLRVDVSFETFNDEKGEKIKLKQEDFVTLKCRCELMGIGQGLTPSHSTITNEKWVVESGGWVEKMIGKPLLGKQNSLCEACCRDHHDNAEMVAEEHSYRTEAGLPHTHYALLENTTYQQALVVGDVYDEVCRFKRVDGLFTLFPDWQLVELLMLSPDDLLNTAEQANYNNHISAVIRSVIHQSALPLKSINRKIDIEQGSQQLTVRGLYIDYLRGADRAFLQSKMSNNETNWSMPFYEVNLTLLAHWTSSDPAVAMISNEPIINSSILTGEYYHSFSRGKLTGISRGVTTISVSASSTNSTMAGVLPISPQEQVEIKENVLVSIE